MVEGQRHELLGRRLALPAGEVAAQHRRDLLVRHLGGEAVAAQQDALARRQGAADLLRRGSGAVRAAEHPGDDAALGVQARLRSYERRVGKECVSTCTSWWSPYP